MAEDLQADSPKDLMAAAKTLAATDKAEAFFLLVENRTRWDRVPQAYDALVGRLGGAANLPQAAATYLQRAIDEREAANADIAANLLKMHGEALRKLGRITEAAAYFSRAVAAGAAIGSLSSKAQMALAEREPDDDTGFPPGAAASGMLPDSTVYDSRHRALLVYVPKVACTVLKATVVMNSPLREAYLASGQSIHRFVAQSGHASDLESVSTAPALFRWTVIRDPARRLLSAYLNKFVVGAARKLVKPDKVLAIRGGQRLAGVAFDPVRSISFAEFVGYLMTAHDLEMNVHWMPQTRIVGTDIGRYDHVGCMERLDATFDILAERFGYVPEKDSVAHLGGAKRHSTAYDANSRLAEPHRALPKQLRKFRDGFPPAENFLTPELTAMIEQRYAEDVALHRAALAC